MSKTVSTATRIFATTTLVLVALGLVGYKWDSGSRRKVGAFLLQSIQGGREYYITFH